MRLSRYRARDPSSEAAVRFLLIPVANALPAVQAHFEQWSDDDAVVSAEELRELIELTVRYVWASEALLRYAEVVGGKPSKN